MRDAQKEAARTHRKDFKATARYWEDMVDKYLESADKNDRGPVLQLKEKAAPGPGAA
ncbi:hypothetical protein AGMMS50268_21230 [Spirochaetia bacterium]|nr:hypothetical protein AGMMS50268_21230 [Spirochaetia bacterium]